MTTEGKKCGSFMTVFVPGLVLGIIVGGIAGAFLPPVLERMGVGMSDSANGGPVKASPAHVTSERDARISEPATAPKPAEPTAATPDPKATTPADAASPAPKTEPKPELKPETKPADPATPK